MEKYKLRPGDVVEVRPPLEILETLDSNGTNSNLPFMPEMIQFCGRKYKVSARMEKTCVECNGFDKSNPCGKGEFINDDVVSLENIRCSGTAHGGCQVGCLIFWKEGWLKKSNESIDNIIPHTEEEKEILRNKLKVVDGNKTYFCQSSQLAASTKYLPMKDSITKLVQQTFEGNIKIKSAAKSIIHAPIRRIRPGSVIKGQLQKTPTEFLNLQPGDTVEVKSYNEILKTLNKQGKNRGLTFYFEMKKDCGKRFTVRNRLEKMINEVNGEMMELKNTVLLEDSICNYEDSFLGCPRQRFKIWREIWLKRV